MQLQPSFHFLEVAYPYIARRLLTDEDPALRERLFQVPLYMEASLFCRHLGLCPYVCAGSATYCALDILEAVTAGLEYAPSWAHEYLAVRVSTVDVDAP